MEGRGRPERRLLRALAREDGLGTEMSVLAYPAWVGRWGVFSGSGYSALYVLDFL